MDEIVCRRPMGCVQSIIENMKLIITNLSTLREGGLKSENTKGRYSRPRPQTFPIKYIEKKKAQYNQMKIIRVRKINSCYILNFEIECQEIQE